MNQPPNKSPGGNQPAPSGKADKSQQRGQHSFFLLLGLTGVIAVLTVAVTALLINIFERRQEAQRPFVRLVEVDELTTDPAIWGTNWPDQYDAYLRTVDRDETEFGGSSAMPQSKLDAKPWLRRLYAGYAFSLDYRDARGHAYMLYDQQVTQRVTQRTQSGACLHCHASIIPTYRRLGLEAAGQEATPEALAADFNWTAVLAGFKAAAAMDYTTARAELDKTPDHLPGANEDDAHALGHAHPVSCIDCHDPKSMRVRVTRPGFFNGIAALAASDAEIPFLASIDRWRKGDRREPYDPNALASRQELRTFVCAQCHVEYYCASKETLFFPWDKGLKVEQIEQTYDEHSFPDGTDFYDFKHGETGAEVYKAQHPEFELWSQGIHARSGVSCADCHMPYERQGAMKISSHWVRSPLLNINRSCQTCHNEPEAELRARVEGIQARTESLIGRAAAAMTDMLDAILDAEAAGATPDQLAPILELQKKGMWRLDFISSENSKGFHADQESARIFGESIDYSRQAQALAIRLRAGEAPESEKETTPILGVTPSGGPPVDEPR